MNETNVKTRQIALLTYEKNGNHYYDTTFSIPLDFKPNARGLYNVEINEVLFKNDEFLLEKGKDYLNFDVETYDGTLCSYRYTLKENIISTPDARNFKKIYSILKCEDTYLTKTRDTVAIPDLTVKLYQMDTTATGDGTDTGKLKEVDANTSTPIPYLALGVMVGDPTNADATDEAKAKTSKIISLTASNNFLYMFKNLFKDIDLKERLEYMPDAKIGTETDPHYNIINRRYFEIFNLKRSGPVVFILDTNIKANTPTINENGQVYNIMAKTYNLADEHNSIQQMNSTMRGTVKDLTNLRIRLLNDFFEPVKIFNPVSIGLTISNSD